MDSAILSLLGAFLLSIIGLFVFIWSLRQGLLARGFDKRQITAEGYWRPGRQGGHDHIRDETSPPVGRTPPDRSGVL